MTPKEKAEDLLDKMERQTYKYQEYAGAIYKTCEIGYEGGKKCALIAVDEILNALSYKVSSNLEEINYFVEVKQEIQKL